MCVVVSVRVADGGPWLPYVRYVVPAQDLALDGRGGGKNKRGGWYD